MYCNWCSKTIDSAAEYCQQCGRAVSAVKARKLERPRDGRKIAGVALALANYLDLDVTLVRLVWVLVAIFGGCGLLAYFVAWVIIPNEPTQTSVASPVQQHAQAG